MNARYARAMHLNPLLGEARVVDISNIKMDADERTIHLIEECPEFPGRQQEALFRIAVLATDFDSRLGCNRSKLLHGVETALVHLVVRNLLGQDRKSTRLNSSHGYISYAVFCLKKKKHRCA